MAMTLADVRAKYPQYKDVEDKKLADAIYNKHYAGKDRREFDARIGLKPYQNALEATATAIGNLPGNIAESKYGIGQLAAETVSDIVDPRTQFGNTPPLKVTPGAPIEDLLTQPAGVTLPVRMNPTDPVTIASTAAQLLPEGVRRGIAEGAAMTSLGQQLRRAEAAEAQDPIDVAPGSLEEIAASAGASVVEMAAPALASVLVRNPAPLVAYFTARSAGTGYNTARDEGTGTDTARAAAGLYAAAEAVTEAIAGKVLIEGGKTLIGSILKTGVAEGLTEAATEALQALIDAQVIGMDMTLDDALQRIKVAGAAGAVAGGVIAPIARIARGAAERPTQGIEVVEPAVVAEDVPIEDRIGLPGPPTVLALPSPEQFRTPDLPRRQPDAPRREEPKPPTEDQIDYQAQIALQRTKQAETAELLQTARETITPLGTFSVDEIGLEAAGKVRQHRILVGRPVEAPVTIEDMARAKVPQRQIDAVIAQRRPVTSETPLTALDIMRAADAKNIIPTDTNFSELALRTTGQRNVQRMTQAQLNALKTTLDAMPAHPTPVTVPLAEQSPFTDDQYGKALDAVRQQGRYTASAIKEATGLKATKDVDAVRDAMVRRGQLVERGKGDYRLYDTLGVERQSVPDDLPPGAFREYTARRVPVSKVRVTKNGKSVGTFSSATQARETVSKIREKDRASAVAIEPAADTAWGVMENRYDEQGNLLGSVVVDSYRDEADAQKALERLNAPPDTGARYTQTDVTPPPSAAPGAAPTQRPPMPPAFAGRLSDIVKRLNAQARDRKLPLLGVRVQLKPEITGPDGAPIEGFYLRKVISLATQYLSPGMSTDQIVEVLARVMDHETVHALRAAGVLSPETDGWKTIVRYTRRAKRPDSTETYFDWAQRNYGRPGNPDGPLPGYETRDSIEEEAIAEAFRAWASNRRNVAGKPATVFRQIVEWFKRLLNAVPEDAFRAIETGTMVSEALTPRGSDMTRARETRKMESAAAEISEAQKVRDENLVQVKSREYLRAREQARDDRFGKSGPKTVLGTTPTKVYATGEVGDVALARSLADTYRQQNGVEGSRLMTLLPVDAGYMARVADAQQRATHAPGDAAVAKAYRALINETKRMYQALGELEVTAWTAAGAPYDSPASMLGDIASGKLTMRLSDDTFGPGADNPGHPLNAASGYKTTDGRALTNNDIFRVVHDVYGHGQSGFVSDERGSYNAYHEHARLLSPEARRALATETLAQDAWHRFGPHLRRSDGTVPRGRVVGEGANAQVIGDVDYLADKYKEFAEQKAFLLDEELVGADPGWALADRAVGVEETPRFSLALREVFRDVQRGALNGLSREQMRAMNRAFDSRDWTEERIPVASLVATQETVNDDFADSTARRKGDAADVYRLPIVVKAGGKNYVLDGHHRIAAAIQDGETYVDVRYVDVDRLLDPPDPRQTEMRFSKFDDNLPGGRLYGNPNRSPGGALSAPGTPTPAFTSDRPGNQFFGGELAEEQLRMAREGDRGAAMIYMSPDAFLALTDAPINPEQEVYNEAIEAGYKLSGFPSLVTSGYAGIVRAVDSDSTAGAAALVGRADQIPVVLYPKDGQSLGLVTALEAPDGSRMPWPHEGRQENFPEDRIDGGPKYSLNAPFNSRVPRSRPTEEDEIRYSKGGEEFDLYSGETRPSVSVPPTPTAVNTARVHNAFGDWLSRVGRSKRSVGSFSIFETRKKVQNRMLDVKEWVEFARNNDLYVHDLNDPYQAENLYYGATQNRLEEAERDLYAPLMDAMAAAADGPNKITNKDLGLYAYAMHAPERNAKLRAEGSVLPNPSGMSDARASQLLDQFALDGKMPELQVLYDLLRKVQDDVTAVRKKYGTLGKDVGNDYDYYVTLTGAEADLDGTDGLNIEGVSRPKRNLFSIFNKEDKSATGRSTEVDAELIVPNIVAQHSNAIIRGESNVVALAGARLAQTTGGKDGWPEILATKPTRRVRDANGMIREMADPFLASRPDIFVAKWDGKEVYVKAPPEIARAMKQDYGSVTHPLVRFLINAAGMASRWQSLVNVQASPEFMVVNSMRGAIEAGVLAADTDIKGISRDIYKNYVKAAGGVHAVLREGTFDRAVYEKIRGKYGPDSDTAKWAEIFREMKEAGGTTGMVGINTMEDTARRIRRHVTNGGLHVTARKAMNYLNDAGKFISDYNDWTENIVRLAAYDAGRRAGMTPKQAAALAKNVGPNFNRGGEWKSVMSQLYVFFNAGAQGATRYIQALRVPRVQYIIGTFAAAAITMDIANRLMSGDDDEDGIKDYDNIPDHVLRSSIVVMDPFGILKSVGIEQGYFSLNLPFGLNAFWNLGRNMSNMWSGSPVHSVGRSFSDIGVTFLDAYNPMGGAQDLANLVAPTIADPFVDLMRNKDFAGNDIVPERRNDAVPESQKYWSNTGDVPKWVAEHLNRLGGGNEFRKGKDFIEGFAPSDISPEVIQFWYDYATGSTGKFFERVAGFGVGAITQDFQNIEIGRIPFARRFVGSAGNQATTERYYSAAEAVHTVRRELEGFTKSGRPEEARAAYERNTLEAQMIETFKQSDAYLRDLRDDLVAVRGNDKMDPKQKREIIDRIKDLMDQHMTMMVERYYRAKFPTLYKE